MSKASGGKSALTSNTTLLLYYICAFLALFTGFTILVAAVGALVSRSVAHKEAAVFTIKHCTWLFRTIWVFSLLALLLGGAAMYVVGAQFTFLPDTSHITSFAELWGDPVLRSAVQYTAVWCLLGIILVLWYVYRLLRGAIMLLCYTLPTGRGSMHGMNAMGSR